MLMLRSLRKSRGLTMKELGEVIGVAESTMSLYETGKREPDFGTLIKLGEYFNVSVDYLLRGGEENKAPAEKEPPAEADMGVLLDSIIGKLKSGDEIMFKNYSLAAADAALLADSLSSVERMTTEMARQRDALRGEEQTDEKKPK